MQFPQSFCCFWGLFCTKNEEILHPGTVSYTQSYTRKRLYILDISPCGVGNVVFFRKTFFVENVEAVSKREEPEIENIGLL